MEERTQFKFLGVVVGTYDGWDDIGVEGMQLYSFKPNPGVNLPESPCFVIMYETGQTQTINDDGSETNHANILDILKTI